MPPLYLDYNATHPPDMPSLQKAIEIYSINYANTSGISRLSQKAAYLLEEARRNISTNLDIDSKQIIFTSSASESNALFIQSMLNYNRLQNKKKLQVYASPLDHPSVIDTLEAEPDIETKYLNVNKNGALDLENLEIILKNKQADFLCISHTHNETGIFQPFDEIVKILREYPVVTLVDATQTLPKLNKLYLKKENIFLPSKDLPVFFSASGHKIGAGFGTGILIRPDLPIGKNLEHYVFAKGGGQEFKIRSGTHNLPSILAFDMVLTKRMNDDKLLEKLFENTSFFEEELSKELNVEIIGANSHRMPGVSGIIFKDINVDFLLLGLDQKEITVSTGSSCKSKAKKVSKGLVSMGISEKDALNVLRFSYGKSFNDEQSSYTVNEICDIAKKIK